LDLTLAGAQGYEKQMYFWAITFRAGAIRLGEKKIDYIRFDSTD